MVAGTEPGPARVSRWLDFEVPEVILERLGAATADMVLGGLMQRLANVSVWSEITYESERGAWRVRGLLRTGLSFDWAWLSGVLSDG